MLTQRRPITTWNLLRSRAACLISQEDELVRLQAVLESCRAEGWLEHFDIFEDEPTNDYPRPMAQLHRFVVHLTFSDGREIYCNGLATHRAVAMLKALSEAVERIVYVRRERFSWISYRMLGPQWGNSPPSLRTTNGLAMHRTFAEAFQASLCESIERHSVLLHWYTKTPALARFAEQELAVEPALKPLADFVAFSRRNDISFQALHLDQLGAISVVFLLATTTNPALPFHVCSAFAAHSDIRRALLKAYGELTMDLLSLPKTKRKKSYLQLSDVEDISDHALYFQTPERIACFDFLTPEDLPKAAPQATNSSTLAAYRNLCTTARYLQLCAYEPILPKAFQNFVAVKTVSTQLLELDFGKDHAAFDRSLLSKFSNRQDFSIPHPIS